MKFFTQFDILETEPSVSGSGVKTTYGLHYDKLGRMELKEKGKVDLYSEIQSHADSCDIHVIIKRFLGGDETVLNKRLGQFADVSEFPSTFAEVLNTMASAEDFFMTLTPEIRAKFNNSVTQFVASLDNPETASLFVASKDESAPSVISSGEESVNSSEPA